MPRTPHKVLFLITKSNFGGAQRYVYDLATSLPPETYTPVVACGGTGERGATQGGLVARLTQAGIRTVPIPHFMRNMSLLDDMRAFLEILTVVRRERPHVLHVTSSKAGGMGVLAGRLLGVPRIVFTSHGLTFDETWRPAWQRFLIRIATWWTILLSHTSIMISQETYARARALPFLSRKVVLIYNGCAPIPFAEKYAARAHLIPDASDSVLHAYWVGSIAEYHPNKNLATLIEATALLTTAQAADVQLVLVSDGEERQALEELSRTRGVAERVHLVGYVDRAAEYLRAFDVFVLPSKKEGLPYVLLEAGLAGLPVIASDIPGNRDIIAQGVTGTLVAGDAAAYVAALQEYLAHPDTARAHASALAERTGSTFSIETMRSNTLAHYISSNPATSRSRSPLRTDRS